MISTESSHAPARWTNRLARTASIGPVACEVTPFVWQNRLYRVENYPRYFDFPGARPDYRFLEDEIRVRDVASGQIVSVPLHGHYYGMGFVHDGHLHVFAGAYGPGRRIRTINRVVSDDLVHWSDPVPAIAAEGNEGLFNTAVCRGSDRFVLLYETDDPRWPKFTFKYCESDDLVHWRPIPGARYGIDKYVGGPALYFADGWYYTLYLQSLPGPRHYETRITRSRDLVLWHDAPEDRPVLPVIPTHVPDPAHPEVCERSASDAELCAWRDRTIIYFNSGNQLGVNGLEQAEFDGPPAERLSHYFD